MDMNSNNKRPHAHKPFKDCTRKDRLFRKDTDDEEKTLDLDKNYVELSTHKPSKAKMRKDAYEAFKSSNRLKSAAQSTYNDSLRGKPIYRDGPSQASSIISRSFLALVAILALLWLSFAIYNYNQEPVQPTNNTLETLQNMKNQPLGPTAPSVETSPLLLEKDALTKTPLSGTTNVVPQVSPRREALK